MGVDYPGSYGALRAWSPDDRACLDYLEWLRWPGGFCCPTCGSEAGWRLDDGRWSCGGCKRRVSVTAGTIFHRTRTPLSVWFAAAWQMTSQKRGISVLGLQRVLALGSTQTAWAMLHRYRTAMVRPGRDRLSGIVEVDETFLGGPEPGKRGRGALDKTLVAVAVEQDGRAAGRCRMQVITDASADTLAAFLAAHVQPGSVVITDDLSNYPSACAGYDHQPVNVSRSGHHAHELLPGVHRVASLTKRWLLGTHQGGVRPAHLQAYLDEFAFRFNRRRSSARGMLFYRLLEQAVQAPPRTYRSLVADPGNSSRTTMPTPPTTKRVRPDSLNTEPLDRPWRRTTPPN